MSVSSKERNHAARARNANKLTFANRFLRSEVTRGIRSIDRIAYICIKNAENGLENNWNLIGTSKRDLESL
jgi:hypothetical protein